MFRDLAFSLTFLTMLVLPAHATRAEATREFMISYWCGPRVDLDQDKAYAEVAECNFTHCFFPVDYAKTPAAATGATPEQNRKILDMCLKHGLKYVLSDSRIFAKDPSDAGFSANLDAVVADYSAHPALAGYFVYDEPNVATLKSHIGPIHRYLRSKDPNHFVYTNLISKEAMPAIGSQSLESYVDAFITEATPHILSYDHYRMMLADLDPLQPAPAEVDEYFEHMELFRRRSIELGIPWNFILLITKHWRYREPTEEDIRWQVNTALVYGATGIQYFTYWSVWPEMQWGDSAITWDGRRTHRYDQIKRINAGLKALAPTLVKFRSKGVYHQGYVPKGCAALDERLPFSLQCGLPAVVGLFQHEDGSDWVIIMNRHLRRRGIFVCQFDVNKVNRVQEFATSDGSLRDIEIPDGLASLDLLPGEAKLLCLTGIDPGRLSNNLLLSPQR